MPGGAELVALAFAGLRRMQSAAAAVVALTPFELVVEICSDKQLAARHGGFPEYVVALPSFAVQLWQQVLAHRAHGHVAVE